VQHRLPTTIAGLTSTTPKHRWAIDVRISVLHERSDGEFVPAGAEARDDAVRDGRVAIHPKEMEPRWFGWVDNMHDWCISRQLWWGHRIPVWYGPDGEVVCVGPDDDPPSGDGWRQDEDVLDTWFSSALWPFSTLGWPDKTPALEKFYPNQVMVTGYDILFFWVARMMMFGLYAMDGKQPFDHVFLHGLIRDATGKKMSKSRGNVIDPLDWLERFGADATRFTLARGANPGSDMAIAEEWAAGSRNFCTKLWNASRFALINGAAVPQAPLAREELTDADRWILDRADRLVAVVDEQFEGYEFAKLCDELYHFTWDEFCDWYLELAKTQLAAGGAADRRGPLSHPHRAGTLAEHLGRGRGGEAGVLRIRGTKKGGAATVRARSDGVRS
jgi:valyl-tRNA synthetase